MYQTTLNHVAEDKNFHSYRRQNIKFRVENVLCDFWVFSELSVWDLGQTLRSEPLLFSLSCFLSFNASSNCSLSSTSRNQNNVSI
jgi:hypothetical protein